MILKYLCRSSFQKISYLDWVRYKATVKFSPSRTSMTTSFLWMPYKKNSHKNHFLWSSTEKDGRYDVFRVQKQTSVVLKTLNLPVIVEIVSTRTGHQKLHLASFEPIYKFLTNKQAVKHVFRTIYLQQQCLWENATRWSILALDLIHQNGLSLFGSEVQNLSTGALRRYDEMFCSQ